MNEGLRGWNQHEGEYLITEHSLLGELPLTSTGVTLSFVNLKISFILKQQNYTLNQHQVLMSPVIQSLAFELNLTQQFA